MTKKTTRIQEVSPAELVHPYHLSQTSRRLILATLVLIFLIAAPATLLYTAGYRYDFKQKIIKTTGALSIEVYPYDATVHLDKTLLQPKNRLTLTRLLPAAYDLAYLVPNTYTVTVSKPGFHSWSTQAMIRGNETTYILGVRLFRDNLPSTIPFDKTYTSMIPSPDGNYLLLTSERDGVYEIDVLNTRRGDVTTIGRFPRQEPHVVWSPQINSAVIITHTADKSLVTFFSPTDERINLRQPVTTYIGTHVQWSKETRNPRTIYIGLPESVLIRHDEQEERIPIPSSSIWYADTLGRLWLQKNNDREIHCRTCSSDRFIELPNSATRIEILTDTFIAYRTKDSTLTLFSRTNESSPVSIPNGEIISLPDEDQFLAYSEHELWHIKNGMIELTTRRSDTITSLIPLQNGRTVLYSTGNEVVALDTLFGVSTVLAENSPHSTIAFAEQNRTIYLLRTNGTIQILPLDSATNIQNLEQSKRPTP